MTRRTRTVSQPRGELEQRDRRILALVLLVAAAVTVWAAAITAARRCERDSPVRVNCHRPSAPATLRGTTLL